MMRVTSCNWCRQRAITTKRERQAVVHHRQSDNSYNNALSHRTAKNKCSACFTRRTRSLIIARGRSIIMGFCRIISACRALVRTCLRFAKNIVCISEARNLHVNQTTAMSDNASQDDVIEFSRFFRVSCELRTNFCLFLIVAPLLI